MSNFTKTLCFTLVCRNAPIKSNWCTLDFCLELSASKYSRVFVDAVGDQVSPIISVFFKSPLDTVLNFNLSRLQSDCIFDLYTSMHGVTVGNQPILWYINCPMFGFQSLLSTVWYSIHKGIIWTSTLRILVSLFDIPSLFDTSSLIDIFLRLSPIYWLVCLQRRENYSQLLYNRFHPYSVY